MNGHKSIRTPWSAEEDKALLQLISRFGTGGCWPQIASMMVARTGKQCRERYINHLDPDIKRTPWTATEDKMIRDLFPSIGSKWSQYMIYLPGRSDNAIKNRYHVISRYGMDSSSGSEAGTSQNTDHSQEPVVECIPCKHSYSKDFGDESSSEPQLKRLKCLHAARGLLDQRIRELEDTVQIVSSSSDSDDLCEEAIMSELGTEFDDFAFLWGGDTAVAPKPEPKPLGDVELSFDFACYEDAF